MMSTLSTKIITNSSPSCLCPLSVSLIEVDSPSGKNQEQKELLSSGISNSKIMIEKPKILEFLN